MSNIHVNRAGTAYTYDQNGVLQYLCQYCDTWFEPTTRFKQKYCGDSCRTMASRERKHGVGGTLEKKREATSNSDLLKQLKVIEEMTVSSISNMYEKLLKRQYEHESKLKAEVINMHGTVKKLSEQLDLLMLITAIAPVVSPAVANWLRQLATGEKPPIEGIKDELATIKNTLDEASLQQLKKHLKSQELQQVASLMGL
ncbi:hypothetical protein WJR50_31025 [Catalinimonas sp. 4WD22]|uniref:hypothetical protein n=1 Tax=Catalinimonas locisalis TaxID=3133978 RepID=UPI003100E551